MDGCCSMNMVKFYKSRGMIRNVLTIKQNYNIIKRDIVVCCKESYRQALFFGDRQEIRRKGRCQTENGYS